MKRKPLCPSHAKHSCTLRNLKDITEHPERLQSFSPEWVKSALDLVEGGEVNLNSKSFSNTSGKFSLFILGIG
jgi:hypothetical protein